MKLSVIIPARDEATCLAGTVALLEATLAHAGIDHEVIIVDDGSRDATPEAVARLERSYPAVRGVANPPPANGYGLAVRAGLRHATGEAIAIMMADGSDRPEDLVTYYRTLVAGVDCVFGSRFVRGGGVVGYPAHKLILNRLANWFIMALFGSGYNDTTNAFKCYRREAVHAMAPLISKHFNLTVEMPLKAIVRGFTYRVVPITWHNRRTGLSKLKIREMGSRYLFIVLYLLLEKWLARGDYRRPPQGSRGGRGEEDGTARTP